MESQTEIPGTERPKIRAIENAAEKYVEVRDTRMDWTKQECAAREKLIAAVMANADKLTPNEKGERVYSYGEDMLVVLKPGKAKVKVKHAATESDEDDEDDED